MVEGPSFKPYREYLPDGEVGMHFHEGQRRAWHSKARFVAMQAGTQGGKTCFEPDWLYREILNRGEGDYLVGTATFPLLELKLLPEFINLFDTLKHEGKYLESKKIFQFNNSKTRILFFSATNPESIESATALGAVLDEVGQNQFKRGTYEAVLRRLSLSQGRILFGTTLYNLGWFKTEVYDRWKAGDPDYDVIEFPSIWNPAFPRQEFERAQQTMPAWKFDMFYRGQYSKPVGLVYDCFDTSVCAKRFPVPSHWPVYVGHDFGSANPAAMFYAHDPVSGVIYPFYEYLPGPGRSTYEHAEEFKKITQGMNVVLRAGGNATTEDEIRQGYAAHGWRITKPRLSGVQAQIDRVYALHKLNKIHPFSDLYNYLDEKTTFSYALDENYKPMDRFEDEARFHLLAAERYVLSDLTPETAINRQKPQDYRKGAVLRESTKHEIRNIP